uniref:Immunoglobulin V-set domain-containing protein n=1 Tax=Xiphophorus couchianus TaxID=32473 RepID=A0A3B5MRT3_9TELE
MFESRNVTPDRCCKPTAVLDRRSGPQQKRVSAEPGSSVTVACWFALSGGTKYFCRGDCGGNALVQTAGESAHSGRYSIQHERKLSAEGVLLVTITELTQSDSGRYHFDITVTPVHFNPPTIVLRVWAAGTRSRKRSYFILEMIPQRLRSNFLFILGLWKMRLSLGFLKVFSDVYPWKPAASVSAHCSRNQQHQSHRCGSCLRSHFFKIFPCKRSGG